MTETSKANASRLGELLREAGVMRATLNCRELIDREELRFLDCVAANGEVTSDDTVNDLADEYGDGGKWRGAIPLRLAREGLIVAAGWKRSCRPSRHGSKITRWAIADREAVDRRRFTLRTKLAALDAAQNGTGPTSGIVEPVETAITHPPTSGDSTNGKAV
jgi:hypothetical protein